jgi:error-prone DNA polymerase
MLSVLQKALEHLSEGADEPLELTAIPPEDPEVYDALCQADTIGVFQIESRAQQNTLPRLRPRRFYDLVVEIALIRPGPIQGQMVHPYLRRRNGEEEVTYLHPDLEPILKRTLGVPIFQEQVMKVAIELAGFTPTQADELRRAMGFRRYSPRMERLEGQLHAGMEARGIGKPVRDEIIKFLTAFGHYGFPESHSASFALLAYASAWLKVHRAPLFTATLINSQPMGFYTVASLVHDARVHGVESRPPCLRRGDWDCTLEPATPGGRWDEALRIGLRCIGGLGAKARDKLEAARWNGPFTSIREVIERTGLPSRALAALARAGAFDAFLEGAGESEGGATEAGQGGRERRREALWAVLREGRIPLEGLDRFAAEEGEAVRFEALTWPERIVQDYHFVGLSTAGHPMEILRPDLEGRRVLRATELHEVPDGAWVATAGMVVVRQRPGTAAGFVFLSLEDETGLSNVIVTPKLFARFRQTILGSSFLEVHGVAQREGLLTQVRGRRFYRLTGGPQHVKSRDFH